MSINTIYCPFIENITLYVAYRRKLYGDISALQKILVYTEQVAYIYRGSHAAKANPQFSERGVFAVQTELTIQRYYAVKISTLILFVTP
jgi:hypothetical protein